MGILQWQPSAGQADLVNLMDYFGTRPNADDWLDRSKGIPRSTVKAVANQPWEQAVQTRRVLLDGNPAIKAYYDGNPYALQLYGLPSTPATDRPFFVVVRLQRGVLVQWKHTHPWAKAGEVTPVLVGDLAKEFGLIPKEALEPELPPEPAKGVSGLATWYGQPFHGRRTASGEVYDMYNPTTTAANIFPMGSWLKVTWTETGNYVIVRVNDTGGFKAPFIVDLSWAAYQKLTGLGATGVVPVVVEIVPGPEG
jgi:hypothetical protein